VDYSDSSNSVQKIKMGGVSTEYATGAIVIGCVIALWLLRRGFRGVGIPGVASVRVAG